MEFHFKVEDRKYLRVVFKDQDVGFWMKLKAVKINDSCLIVNSGEEFSFIPLASIFSATIKEETNNE